MENERTNEFTTENGNHTLLKLVITGALTAGGFIIGKLINSKLFPMAGCAELATSEETQDEVTVLQAEEPETEE